jgi:hypothetical protein
MPFDKAPPGKRIALLWTASLEGYVEPCGCTGDPLGGVARLAAAVEGAQQAYGKDRVLFVDGGDMLFEHATDNSPVDACQAKAKNELLTSTLAQLRLQATVDGPLDDVRGDEWRNDLLSKHGLNADVNVRVTSKAPAIAREIPADNGRVVVTGFRAEAQSDIDVVKRDLLRSVLPHCLDAPCGDKRDVVVVIAQSPRETTKKIVGDVPGIDVVIQGRSPGEVPAPPEKLPSGAVLVAAGQQGQYLGVVEINLEGREPNKPLTLDDSAAKADAQKKELEVRIHELEKQVDDSPRGQFLKAKLDAAKTELASISSTTSADLPPSTMRVRAIPLPRGFAEDPDVAAQLAAYQKSIPSLVASCEQNVTCPKPKDGAPGYVGAEACKQCHSRQYDFWQHALVSLPGKDKQGRDITRTEGHVHAWQTLVVDGKERDRECVACHSVGFDQPGGPCKTSDVVDKKLDGVQCESCHGPGGNHVKTQDPSDIRGQPDETLCRSCHHVPHIPTTASFVFTDRLKLILGPGHGQKRWHQLVDDANTSKLLKGSAP